MLAGRVTGVSIWWTVSASPGSGVAPTAASRSVTLLDLSFCSRLDGDDPRYTAFAGWRAYPPPVLSAVPWRAASPSTAVAPTGLAPDRPGSDGRPGPEVSSTPEPGFASGPGSARAMSMSPEGRW
ncbi:hypothetical protein FAIPA1_480002 [Frankia sp. AiPs1]